ncbi:hypothetical protein KQI65_08020 [bacterium]|nr:hypothetical protein [bacterium]
MEIREIILHRIASILQDRYDETLQELSEEYLTACLAFKGDPHLNELRLALERIRRGDYGRCIFCKEDIPTDVLRGDPTSHFCEPCSRTLRTRLQQRHS